MIAFSCLILACRNAPYQHLHELVETDSLTAVNPRMALHRLDSLESFIMADSSDLMYCHLLRIKAKDRAFIRHTSDDDILCVIDYFERHPEKDLLAWAYCYGGRVYRDLDDTPRALLYFQKSLAALEDNPTNNLRSRVLSQLGYLLYYQYLFNESRNVKQQVIQADSLSGNYASMVVSYSDIARSFIAEQNFDSAYAYASYADSLVRRNHLFDQQARVDLLNAQIKEYQGQHSHAIDIVFPYLSLESEANASPYMAVASRALVGLGRYDEAEPLCHRLLQSDQSRLQTKADALKHLTTIAMQRGRVQETMEYQNQTIILIDSLLKNNHRERVSLVSSYYQNMEREHQFQHLKDEIIQAQCRLNLALFIVFVLLMAALLTWVEYKRHRTASLLAQEKALSRFKSTPLCQQIYSLFYARKPIPPSLWEEIEDYLDDNYPHFRSRLCALSSFSEIEWHITLLSKLDYRNIEIATLLCRNKSAISLSKKRLYAKVKGADGSAKDWDRMIKGIV